MKKNFLKYFLQIVCAKPSIDMGQCQITKRPKNCSQFWEIGSIGHF